MMQKTLAEVVATCRLRIGRPVGIMRCEPVWQLNPYLLTDFLLWCVLDGVGTAWIKGRELPLRPGTCLLLEPGSALSAVHDPKRPLRVFYLHVDFLDAADRRLTGPDVVLPILPVIVRDLSVFEPLTRQVVGGHAADTEPGRLKRDFALRLALLHLHEAAQTHPARSDGTKLAAVLLAVNENPGLAWSVPEIATRAGLSVSQVARRVRDLTGQSPREFVIRARIERARRLMEESSLSLKQIAETLGYTDVYFFHRQFKTVTGVTPGRWRRPHG